MRIFSNPARKVVTSLLSLLAFVCLPLLVQHPVKAQSRDRSVEQDRQPEGNPDRVLKPRDVTAVAAFILLQEFLPAGSHLGSGYRDQNDQIRVIRSYAVMKGIPVPPASVTDPDAWRPAVDSLRKLGYVIAYADRSPHSSDQKIVLDIGRADMGQIEAGCYRAQKQGWIKILNLIREPKQGIHVELNITERGMYRLGARQSVPVRTDADSEAPVSDDATQQLDKQVMQRLTIDHERSIGNPERQIMIDLSRQELLDPINDFDRINQINEDIKRHRGEIEENKKNEQKQSLLVQLQDAEREGRSDDAVRVAGLLAQNYQEPNVLAQVRIRSLLAAATSALIESGCDKCKEADKLVSNALEISANDEEAKRIKNEVDICLNRCNTRLIARIVLAVLVVGGIGVALYFSFRPKGWLLEVVDGPGTGEMFAVDKERVVIGAVPTEEGAEDGADIVISDPEHRISRVHCVLRQRGRSVYLKDKSKNGTSINTKPVAKDTYVKLRNGDEIELADAVVLLLRPGEGKRK